MRFLFAATRMLMSLVVVLSLADLTLVTPDKLCASSLRTDVIFGKNGMIMGGTASIKDNSLSQSTKVALHFEP